MDDLRYDYNPDLARTGKWLNNQMYNINDAATDLTDNVSHLPIDEIRKGDSGFTYDAIGNIVSLKEAGASAALQIKWNVYGKVAQVLPAAGGVIDYTYDAFGNRLTKKLTDKLGVVPRWCKYVINIKNIYTRNRFILNKKAEKQAKVCFTNNNALWKILSAAHFYL